jgi:hypothetical protein
MEDKPKIRFFRAEAKRYIKARGRGARVWKKLLVILFNIEKGKRNL